MLQDEDYFAAVEAHFVERRGSPLFITPGEWFLVSRWEEQGIPLRVVQEGIDRVFERPRDVRHQVGLRRVEIQQPQVVCFQVVQTLGIGAGRRQQK